MSAVKVEASQAKKCSLMIAVIKSSREKEKLKLPLTQLFKLVIVFKPKILNQ